MDLSPSVTEPVPCSGRRGVGRPVAHPPRRRWRHAAVALALLAAAGCGAISSPPLPDRGVDGLVGMASWYGSRHHGRRTASGQLFDMHAMVAAHRTLPFGARVRVTNVENGKSAVVRVVDRGPHAQGRIIDVSYAAAKTLDMLERGVVRVRLELLAATD